mgnify:CR=1 FL=1
MLQKTSLPLVRLSLIQPFVQELDRRGLSTDSVLAENGLARETLKDDSVFVPPIVIHRFLEGAARQPELIPMLRTQFFIVMGLTDAVPMIAVGLGMYILFALAG